jgi:hypothetical protein
MQNNDFSLTLRRLLESFKRGEKSKVEVKYDFIKNEDPQLFEELSKQELVED